MGYGDIFENWSKIVYFREHLCNSSLCKEVITPVGKTDELVVAHVEVLKLGIEPQSSIHSPNVVLLQLESLDAGIECDRENFQLAVGAGNCK